MTSGIDPWVAQSYRRDACAVGPLVIVDPVSMREIGIHKDLEPKVRAKVLWGEQALLPCAFRRTAVRTAEPQLDNDVAGRGRQ